MFTYIDDNMVNLLCQGLKYELLWFTLMEVGAHLLMNSMDMES